MKRILGVDYGDVRVGLAISDELGITAQGLDTFVINGSIKKLISHIINLTKTYDVQTIVFGYPKNMNGTMSEKTKKVDEIISLLKEKESVAYEILQKYHVDVEEVIYLLQEKSAFETPLDQIPTLVNINKKVIRNKLLQI